MGAPSIDGGMTSEEYKALQADERAWAASQEEAAYQRSLEMEADRRDFELAQQEKIGSIEDAEQLAIQNSEEMLQAEMFSGFAPIITATRSAIFRMLIKCTGRC